MRRIFDGLQDAAAQVVSPLGETLLQTPLSVALIGDESVHTGLSRSKHDRWFTDPATRLAFGEEGRLIDPDQAQQLVVYTAAPGTGSAEKLELLAVIGARRR